MVSEETALDVAAFLDPPESEAPLLPRDDQKRVAELCGGRRTAEPAAHLVDRVLPDVPARQWVLPSTWRLRFLLAYDPAPCRAVRRLFLRAVLRWQDRRAAHRPKVEVTLRVIGSGLEVDPVTGEPGGGVGRFVYDDSRRVEYPVIGLKPERLDEMGERLEELTFVGTYD